MSQFKLPKSNEIPEVDPAQIKAFAAGAKEKDTQHAAFPWLDFDPKAKPNSAFLLRVNDYELALVRHIAQLEERSMQQIFRRLLSPILAQQAKRLEHSNEHHEHHEHP